MSKKMWLLLIVVSAFIGYALVVYNIYPPFTEAIRTAETTLINGWNANPLGIASAIGGTVTAVVTGAKLLWNRTKTGLEGTYSALVGEKDRQLDTLASSYQTVKAEAETVQGKLNAAQSELESVKASLAETQQKLASANTELQRKMDEYNASLRIKAIADKFPVENPTCH